MDILKKKKKKKKKKTYFCFGFNNFFYLQQIR